MYKLSKASSVVRIADSANIPNDPDNRDYVEYLAWVAEGNTAQADVPALAELKASKLAEINAKASAVASTLTTGYPEFEMQTWPQQEAESLAWVKDNSAPTPMIDLMASTRGIPRALFLQKTADKVGLFRQASAYLVGMRQKYEDVVNAATTSEEVAAIDPVYPM